MSSCCNRIQPPDTAFAVTAPILPSEPMKTTKATTPAETTPASEWKPIDQLTTSTTVLMRDADGVQHRGYLFHGVFHNVNGITIHAYTPVEFCESL